MEQLNATPGTIAHAACLEAASDSFTAAYPSLDDIDKAIVWAENIKTQNQNVQISENKRNKEHNNHLEEDREDLFSLSSQDDSNSNAIGLHLAALRDYFNPTNLHTSSKADSTFNKHHAPQQPSKVHFSLYKNHPEYVDCSLIQALDDINAEVDYTEVEQKHHCYHHSGGKKSQQEHHEEHRMKIIYNEIVFALGDPGTSPPYPTEIFYAIESKIDVFIQYITEVRGKWSIDEAMSIFSPSFFLHILVLLIQVCILPCI